MFLYVVTDGKRLWKFDLSDGNEVWSVSTFITLGSIGYDIRVDLENNVYVTRASFETYDGGFSGAFLIRLGKFAAADGAITIFEFLPSGQPLHLDTDMGRVISVSSHNWTTSADSYYQNNIFSTDLDGSNPISTQIGTPIGPGAFSTFHGPGSFVGAITSFDGFFYLLISGNIYKLDSELNTIASIAGPDDMVGIFVGLVGELIVINHPLGGGGDDVFWYYDTDLNLLKTSDEDYYTLLLNTWGASSSTKGNAVFFPAITSQAEYFSNTLFVEAGINTALRLIPFEYSTDDAYVLSLGEKYMGFYSPVK